MWARTVFGRIEISDPGAGVLRATCSLGLARVDLAQLAAPYPDWQSVLRLAEQCLYAARSSGRNVWVGVESMPGFDKLTMMKNQNVQELSASEAWNISASVDAAVELRWG